MMSPSHIIPIHVSGHFLLDDLFIFFFLYLQVGDAALASLLCNHLLDRYSIYLQSINYPTVERGTERLRIAATPYHTNEMIDQLVDALKQVWTDVGLPLKTIEQQQQQQHQRPSGPFILRQHA